MLSFCITASAAGNSTIKGNGSATVGSNIEFTVNVSGCDDATSIAVAVNYGDEFELVSGTWLKNGSINKFDTSTNKGALGGLSSPDVNGNLFKLILKAKTASTSSKSVSVNVIAKNGSNEIMNVTSSISVKINCATHSYGNYTNANATNHSRTCSVCGNVEMEAHIWDNALDTKCNICDYVREVTYTGWIKENNNWYYYVDNIKQTGWLSDNGTWYYLNSDGVMQTGWLKSGNTWYYLKDSGAMATGWEKVNGT